MSREGTTYQAIFIPFIRGMIAAIGYTVSSRKGWSTRRLVAGLLDVQIASLPL
jgi:hypothetical protein